MGLSLISYFNIVGDIDYLLVKPWGSGSFWIFWFVDGAEGGRSWGGFKLKRGALISGVGIEENPINVSFRGFASYYLFYILSLSSSFSILFLAISSALEGFSY